MKKIPLLIVCLLLLVMSTCTKDAYNPDVCFNENVLPIFISNCTMSGCHNPQQNKGGYDLTNYDGIMKGIVARHPLRSELFNSIRGSNPSMPPRSYPKLTNKEVSYVKIWIEMGALNSSNCNSCDTTEFTFSKRVNPLMQSWCVGCHNPSNSGGSINLSGYAGVAATVTSHRLLGSLQHLQGYSPMPQNGGRLSPCDIHAIEKWINAGYPNN
jgi:cytochrome c553